MRNQSHLAFNFVLCGLLAFVCCSCSPQAKKEKHLAEADEQFAAGKYAEAEIEYMNVLQVEPLNPQAITRLGLIFQDQGRLSRAIPYLVKAKELQPENLEVRLKLGILSITTGNFSQATEEAKFVLQKDPQNEEAPMLVADSVAKEDMIEAARQQLLSLPSPAPEKAPVLVGLGSLAFRQRDLPKAKELFQRAITQAPNFGAAHAAMGNLYRAQNNLAAAEIEFQKAAELSPARSSRRLSYAKFKAQSGDIETAKRTLQDITKNTPDFLPAWLLLAEIIAGEKKYPESMTLVAKALALDSNHPEALLLSSRLKLAQGNSDQAIVDLQKLIKIYPRSAQAHYQLATVYYANGDVPKTILSLNQAITFSPNFAEAIVMLAEINLRKGDVKAAIAALTSLTAERPDFTQASFLLAEAYRSQKNLKEAFVIYQQLEARFPNSPQVHYGKGMLLLEQNNRDAARKAFGKALELSPNYWLALDQLVNLDLADKEYGKAQQKISKQITLNPQLPGPYLLQAKAFIAQNLNDQAETALKRAIELQPEAAVPYLMLARLYSGTKQLEKALANFQSAALKNPKNLEALMMTALIQNQRGKFDEAREAYERLLQANPRFIPALNNLAYLYSEQFNLQDKAQELAQKALDLSPHDSHAADTLGWILFKKKQYSWALIQLQGSAAKQADDPEVHFHLGMTHYMLGNDDAARSALQRTLQLDKDFAEKSMAEDRLAILAIDPSRADSGARERLEAIIKTRPDDSIALNRLAAFYIREGSVEKAIASYQQVVRSNSQNIDALAALAQLHADRKETAKALELAKDARKIAPDDAKIAHTLGRLAYQTGDHTWAFSLLQESAGKNPDDGEVLYDLANAAFSVGRITDGLSYMKRALQGAKPTAQAGDARLFIKLVETPETTPAELEQALSNNPNYLPALVAKATAMEKSDPAAASLAYEKILGIYPNFTPAMKRLTLLHAERRSTEQKALDIALKARTAFPDDGDTAKATGILLYLRGDYSRAINLLKQTSGRKDQDAVLMFYLGMSQFQLKQPVESKQSLQRALDLNLKADLASEAKQTLTSLK